MSIFEVIGFLAAIKELAPLANALRQKDYLQLYSSLISGRIKEEFQIRGWKADFDQEQFMVLVKRKGIIFSDLPFLFRPLHDAISSTIIEILLNEGIVAASVDFQKELIVKVVRDATNQYSEQVGIEIPSAIWKFLQDLATPMHGIDKNTQEIPGLKRKMEEAAENILKILAQQETSSTKERIYSVPIPARLDLIGRDEIIETVKSKIVSGQYVALYGLPGIGKTSITLRILSDEEILNNFHKLWADVGQSLSIFKILERWGEHAGIKPKRLSKFILEKDEEGIRNQIKTRIGQDKALIILDDIWSADDISHLRISSVHNASYLYTTRSPKVANLLVENRNNIVKLPALSPKDSIELLKQIAPKAVESHYEECMSLVIAVGGLPLAIKITGQRLSAESEIGADFLQKALTRLDNLDERLSISETVKSYDNEKVSLEAVISLSYDYLSEDAARVLRALSILKPIPNTFSTELAEAVTQGFKSSAKELIYQSGLVESIAGTNRYVMHQTVVDFAKAKLQLSQEETSLAHMRLAEYFVRRLSPYKEPYSHIDDSIKKVLSDEASNAEVALEWLFTQEMRTEFFPTLSGYCNVLTNVSKWGQVIYWGKKAYERSVEVGDKLAQAQFGTHILAWPMWMRGEYVSARIYCMEGIAVAKKLSDPYKFVYLCFGLHNLHKTALEECQNTDETEQELIPLYAAEMQLYAKQCLQFASLAKNSNLHSRLIGLAYGDLGWTATKLGNYEEARSYFQKRLELVDREVDKAARKLDIAIATLGMAREGLTTYDEAKGLFLELESILQQLKRDDIEAEVYFGLHKIYQEENLALANEYEDKANDLWYQKQGFDRDPFVRIALKPLKLKVD